MAQSYDARAHADSWVQQAKPSAVHIANTIRAGRWSLTSVTIGAQAQIARTATHASVGAEPSPQGSAGGATRAPATAATTAAPVTRTFSYDARGDRTREVTAGAAPIVLGYNQAGRLVEYGGRATYEYNGDGLRTSKTVAGTTTDFVWNEAEAMPELLQSGSTSYVYGPENQPIEQLTEETPSYLHQDQQGSTRLVSDAGGDVTGRYTYDPWGAVTRFSGSTPTDLQFDGQLTDAESGFQYLRTRYYDPSTGQFLTRDPAFAVTQARYGFAGNDPLSFGDPNGQLFGIDTLLGAAIGGVVGTVTSVAGYGIGVFSGQTDFSWRGLGASAAGGLVGGALAGACTGTVWVVAAGCGAIGGAAGETIDELLSGQKPNYGNIFEDAALGALGGGLGQALFPLRGFVPYKLINVFKPGINALRVYAGDALGGVVDIFGKNAIRLVQCWDS
jgi:RHS repeat-associated protein